jgi:hypothetical protein
MACGAKKRKYPATGTRLDRYGHEGGSYVSPAGTPYGATALLPGSEKKPYNVYQIKKFIDNVEAEKIAPWFGRLGFWYSIQTA